MLRQMIPWRERPLLPTYGRFSEMLNRMDEEMRELSERFWDGDGDESKFLPSIDVSETEKQFEVTVDLPGLKPEDVNIELKENELWISGKRDEEKKEEGKTFHRVERRHGEFRRVLPLPGPISEEQIEAKVENGVLHIVVPKTEPAKTKKIEVKG